MTNKLQLIAILTLTTILITGGFGLTQLAYSSGSSNDKKADNKKADITKHDDDEEEDEDDDDKVKVCHIPLGNEENAHTITISQSAWAAHQMHGDYEGECDDDDDEQMTKPTITIVNNVASDPQQFEITVSPTVGIPEVINPITTKYTVDSHTKVTISGSEDRPILITGDGNCPENNGGFVNIENGQNIECTYSDRPVGQAGPLPTVTLKVNVIDADLGVTEASPPSFQVDGNNAPLNAPIDLIADKATEITQTNDNVPGDVDENNEVLPTKITGDGHCPEVLAGTITLSTGQDIECVFEYGKVIEPGVIFHFNTLAFSFDDDGYGDSCDNVGTMPCIELANAQDGTILIVDEEIKSDTLIFLFSVIEQDKINNPRPLDQNGNPIMGILASSPLCTFSGISPHDEEYALLPGDPTDPGEFDNPVNNPSGELGFAFTCTLASPSGKYNVNYALIETV